MDSSVYRTRGSYRAATAAASPLDETSLRSPLKPIQGHIEKSVHKPLADIATIAIGETPVGRLFSSSPSPSPVMDRSQFRSPIVCNSPVFSSSPLPIRDSSPIVMRPARMSLRAKENIPPEVLQEPYASFKRRLIAPIPVRAVMASPKPMNRTDPFVFLSEKLIVNIVRFIFPKPFQSETGKVKIENFSYMFDTMPSFLHEGRDCKEEALDSKAIDLLSDWLGFDHPVAIPSARPRRPIIDVNCKDMAAVNRVSKRFRKSVTEALGKPLENFRSEIRSCKWIILFKDPNTIKIDLIFQQILIQGGIRIKLLIEFLVAGYRIVPARVLRTLENHPINHPGFDKNYAEALYVLICFVWNRRSILQYEQFLFNFFSYNSAHVVWLIERIHKEENEPFKKALLDKLTHMRIEGMTILQVMLDKGDHQAISLLISKFPQTVQKLLEVADLRLIKAELGRKQACLALLNTVARPAGETEAGLLPIKTPLHIAREQI